MPASKSAHELPCRITRRCSIRTALGNESSTGDRRSDSFTRSYGRRLSKTHRRPSISRDLLHAARGRRTTGSPRFARQHASRRCRMGGRGDTSQRPSRRLRVWDRDFAIYGLPTNIAASRIARGRPAKTTRAYDAPWIGWTRRPKYRGSSDSGNARREPSGHPFDGECLLTMPFGEQGNNNVAIGSLDLLAKTVQPSLLDAAVAISAGGRAPEEVRDLLSRVGHERFDVVIMNPPFTRSTGMEGRGN